MRRALLIALAGVLAGACGGGGGIALGPSDGGVGSGGTGAVASVVASGPIEGFGSIIVNGTRFDIDAARAELRDTSQLKLGMTVQITGTVSADLRTGTATVVSTTTQAKGPVSGLDRTARTFTVLGVRVTVDDTTVFAEAGGLDALAEATPVQVWGITRAGALLATRVERQSAAGTTAPEQVITDTAREVDPSGRSFKVGSLVVSYPTAIPAEVVSALAAGAPVRVRGTTDAAGTGLVASSVETAEPAVPAQETVLSLSGNVTGWTGSRFTLDGYTVDASAAQVSGGRNRLGEGARVDVVGPLKGSIVAATRIRLRQPASAVPTASPAASTPAAAPSPAPVASAPAAPASAPAPAASAAARPATSPASPPSSSGRTQDLPASPASPSSSAAQQPAPSTQAQPSTFEAGTFSVAGTVGQFVSDANFEVQRQAVDASDPRTVFAGGNRRDLVAGRKVEVTGTRVRADVLIAERVEFTDR